MKKTLTALAMAVFGILVIAPTNVHAISLSADVVTVKATLVIQTNQTVKGSTFTSHTIKVKVTTKSLLKLASDNLGLDETFNSGDAPLLGVFTAFNDPVDGHFIVIDSVSGLLVLDLDTAFSNNGDNGYFYITTDSSVQTGEDVDTTNGQEHFIYSNLAWVYYYDGTGLFDGNVHSFQVIGGEETSWNEDFPSFKYKESFEINGSGDAFDGNFEDFVGVIPAGSFKGQGKGVD